MESAFSLSTCSKRWRASTLSWTISLSSEFTFATLKSSLYTAELLAFDLGLDDMQLTYQYVCRNLMPKRYSLHLLGPQKSIHKGADVLLRINIQVLLVPAHQLVDQIKYIRKCRTVRVQIHSRRFCGPNPRNQAWFGAYHSACMRCSGQLRAWLCTYISPAPVVPHEQTISLNLLKDLQERFRPNSPD